MPSIFSQSSAMLPLLLLLLGCCSVQPSAASSIAESLKPLYSATEGFLDTIQPPDQSILLKDVVPMLISRNASSIIHSDWSLVTRQFMFSYLGYSILICIGVFLIVFVPLAGCCVCCCRCCCSSCGGGLNYMERKGSACRRGFYGTLLLIFGTAMLFGCVFALLSNQQLRDQLSGGKAFKDFSNASDSVADSLDKAADRGRNATPRAIDEVAGRLRPRANATLVLFQRRLSSNASLDAAGAFQAVRDAVSKLKLARNLTSDFVARIATYASSIQALNETLRQIKQNLTEPPFACPAGASPDDCRLVNETISRLTGVDKEADAVGRQSLTDLRGKLDGINDTSVLLLVQEVEAALANISAVGLELFDKYIADAQRSLNGSQVMDQWNYIRDALSPVAAELRRYGNASDWHVRNPVTRQSEPLWQLVAHFDAYRYYVFIGLPAFGLLLVLLLFLGLIYGCAGEPPYEDSGCCNRGVGASCMLATVGLGCLLYGLLMFLTVLFFLSGGLTDTEACRYLSGRAGPYGYSLLDKVALQALDSNVHTAANLSLRGLAQKPVSALLSGCSGQPLASALNLSALAGTLGLPDMINRFVNRTIDDLAKRGPEFLSGASFNISELRQLRELAANGSALNFSEFEAALNKPLLNGSLSTLLNAMSNISRNATAQGESRRFTNLHVDLSTAASAVSNSSGDLLLHLRPLSEAFGSLNASLAVLPDRLARLDANLRSQALLRDLIYQSAVEGGLGSADQLLESAVLPALGDLLSSALDCRTLGDALSSAIGAPCVTLLRPFNGFWSGFGLCLICLLPCLVLAIKLANLYRKTQKYLHDFEDGNPKPV